VPASLLKYWLRDLAEPLIPTEFYDDCIKYAHDKEKAIEIVNALPSTNRRIVLYMIRFLQVKKKKKTMGCITIYVNAYS
jgi:hypothetical protein